MENKGIILPEFLRNTDWIAGGITGIDDEIVKANGQYDDDLPVIEYQRKQFPNGASFETLNCTTFGTLNCLEVLLHAKYGITANYSDRELGTLAGNIKGVGNYIWIPSYTIQNFGVVREECWPWTNQKTWEEYYSTIPDYILSKGIQWLNYYDWKYDYVEAAPEKMMVKLENSPLGITVYSGNTEKDGINQASGKPHDHFIMIYGYEPGKYFKAFDNYCNVYKKYAWDYDFNYVMRFSLTNKKQEPMSLFTPKENYGYKLVEGTGGAALYAGGKFRIGEEAKVLWELIARNNGILTDRIISLTQAQWDSIDHYNMKGELIN